MDIGIINFDGTASISSSEVKSIWIDFNPQEIAPWAHLNTPSNKIICGFRLRSSGINVHFKSTKELVQFCESVGTQIAGLLDEIERANYALAAA